MRFSIKQTGCSGERIGTLSGFLRNNTIIETPTAAILTQGGSVVHLTAEVFSKVFTNSQLLWVPLSNTLQMEAGVKAQNEGIAKFAGLQGHIACSTLHSVELTQPGHFELDKIPLWTKHGKKMISADRYMDLMELFKPDIILAIADGRTSLNEGYKRIKKSVDRTCDMLSVCVKRYKASSSLQNSSIIGVIAGAGNIKQCSQCIKNILTYKDSISGVALAGITDGTKDSMEISTEKLEEVFKRVGDALPNDLLRVIEGCWNPATVLAAVERGWDVFDGSYPVHLTTNGLALTLNFHVGRDSADPCILDLNSELYKESFIPILADCECLACKKHTRAYIRHLLNTREMLATVLLNIHNLHHFDQMFQHTRRHIATNTFAIYRQHITKQYELYAQSNSCDKKLEESESKIEKQSNVKKKVRIENGTSNHIEEFS